MGNRMMHDHNKIVSQATQQSPQAWKPWIIIGCQPATASTCYEHENHGVHIAAATDVLWNNRTAYGKLYWVKCTGITNNRPKRPCRDRDVLVEIVDYCKGCNVTLNLSEEAFNLIADRRGRIRIDFNPSPCVAQARRKDLHPQIEHSCTVNHKYPFSSFEAMADVVAGALLSALFQTLFEKLASRDLRSFFRGLKVNEGLLRKLKIALLSANQVLDDAEVKQLTNPNVRKWLFELKDTIYEAEDVLEEINYRALQYEQRGKPRSKPLSKRLQSCLNCFSTFDEAIERKIEEILDRLKFIVEQKDVLGLQEGVTSRLSQRLPAPLPDERYVYGRNDDKEKIMELLLSDNGSSSNKISVIPITGMGGIGKTTLAHVVCEESIVKCQFPIRSWVTVSDDSTLSIIAKRIIVKVTSKKCTIDDPGELQLALKEALSDKMFLLVLDDVWDASYAQLEPLMNCFLSGAQGSKIIVTTRSDTIARKMGNVPPYLLQSVSDDACWKLFEKYVFEDARSETYQELRAIGRDIVKKCNGVPLAVKSLAGLLRLVSDPKEWKQLLSSDIWELQLQGNQSNEILPSLWLSYHYLPSHLKRCFAYCSVFPKDYAIDEFEQENIIQLWMAEGLLKPGNLGELLEDVGRKYFNELISRSLFQPLCKDESTILMHDLMHDLAVFVSGEFSFRLDDKSNAKFSKKARHLSYSKIDVFEKHEGLSEAKSIRSCLRVSSSYEKSSSGVPQLKTLLLVGGCLRALRLSGCGLIVLPDSIGNLKHLRYLDLSDNFDLEEIPNTLCGLYNLQTLRLSWCSKLTQLPTDMGNLVNLRHLDIEQVPLEKMPPKMRNLKDLQTLGNFVIGKNGGSSIEELGGLRFLSGALEISELQNVDGVENVQVSYLKDTELLNKLECRWSNNNCSDDSRKDKDVLDALQPHPKLKELVIDGYGVETFPSWLGHCSYKAMVSVRLTDCCNCRVLPPLGELHSLQELYIYHCRGVERIGAEFYSDGSFSNIKPFRSLKRLEFGYLSKWQEWSFPESSECFPSLEHLRIWDCPKLNLCLPNNFQHFPCLEELRIEDCEELQRFLGEGLHALTSLHLKRLPKLEDLGKGLQHLISLKELSIQDCRNLQCLSKNGLPMSLTSLRLYKLSKFEDLDKGGLQHLISLEELSIENCENLQCLSENGLPTSLTSLHLYELPKLEDLGKGSLQHLISLKQLSIGKCENFRCFSENGLPTSLTSLRLYELPKLEDLDKGGLQHLISLKQLCIQNCENFQCLSENGLPMSLTSLRLYELPKLEELGKGGVQHLISLEELSIRNCEKLNLWYLSEYGGLKNLISLKDLAIIDSEKLLGLLEEELPPSLTSLRINGFQNLRDLNRIGFQYLISLRRLTIRNCGNLQCLPEQGLPSPLSSLDISGCPLLNPRCQKGTGSDWHKISHIPSVRINGISIA